MFCSKCKALLFPNGDVMKCRKCELEVPKKDMNSQKITEKSEEREMLVIEGDLEMLPKTKVSCPNCDHNEAYWVLRQTRAADEPTTRIYRCTQCGHSWREY